MTAPLFATSFAEPAGSPIRELFPYLSLPGMISFAGGYPSPSLFDAEGLQEAAGRALSQSAQCLQYGATEGLPVLREALAAQSQERGVPCKASDVLVTTGSQQAFDLLVRIFIEPGDAVCVETPAYPAVLQALRLAHARIVSVPVDQHGVQVDVLAAQLAAMPEKDRPKLLYTVPTFSNPGGTLLSQERREALVRLADQYQFLVIEDDPYGELAFTDLRLPTLFAVGERLLGAERNPVIYLSSLSKTVAPALRIGWMVAPAAILRRCAIAKQTMDLCTSPLAQLVAAEYLQSGRYGPNLQRACTQYQQRMQTMVQGLQTHLPHSVECVTPLGGMFVWAKIRGISDVKALFQAAVDNKVLYVPGAAFYPADADVFTMRLSFAAPDVPAIEEGVKRLAQAFAQCAG